MPTNNYKSLGTFSPYYLTDFLNTSPWNHIPYYNIPIPLITPPRGYWLTLGSACPISMASTAAGGLVYSASWDIVRVDFNDPYLLNVDQYVAGYASPNSYMLYKMPNPLYHWPKPGDPFISKLPFAYQKSLKQLLRDETSQ
jgi:hypothetical protein